jgi:hypothetical protein
MNKMKDPDFAGYDENSTNGASMDFPGHMQCFKCVHRQRRGGIGRPISWKGYCRERNAYLNKPITSHENGLEGCGFLYHRSGGEHVEITTKEKWF